MVSYKATQYVHENGTKYVFVTKGKSEPFTNEEIVNYINREVVSVKSVEEPKKKLQSNLEITKDREKMFLADLKSGLDFCSKKYGVGELEIRAAAQKAFPSLNLDKLLEAQNAGKSKR